MKWCKRQIKEHLTSKQVDVLIDAWNGREETRDEAIRRLTEWVPVRK